MGTKMNSPRKISLYQSGIELLTRWLDERRIQYRIKGTAKGREQHVLFSVRGLQFDLDMEFPILPVLMIHQSAATDAPVVEWYNADSDSKLKALSKEYYRKIEKMSDRALEGERHKSNFDVFVETLVEFYISIVARHLDDDRHEIQE